MKRLKMIQILRNSVLNHMNSYEPYETDEEIYSAILQDLENAGMLSPSVYAYIIKGTGYRWGTLCTMRCNL